MFCCPVCGGALTREESVLRCRKNHSFDISAKGYINLLLARKKNSRNPGDNGEMIAARTRFLESGAYSPLCGALCEKIESLCPVGGSLLDAGCGEGYYTRRLYEALTAAGKAPHLYGVDLSRRGVSHAAAHCAGAQFAVASVFELPLPAKSLDVVYNVFSPLCAPEYRRVLRPGGAFVAVYPAARHLWELKEILYEVPYENRDKSFELPGLCIRDRERLTFQMDLNDQTLIHSLFTMTPYYYRTPAAGKGKLAALDSLRVLADFHLIRYAPEPV